MAFESAKRAYGSTKRWAGMMGQTGFGRAVGRGVQLPFGIHFEKGINKGFLGRKMPGGMFGKGLFGRALWPAMTAIDVYSGYKQEGLWGATKAIGTNAAIGAAWEVGTAILGGAALDIAAIAAVGYGAYKLGEAAKQHVSGLRRLEMGRDIVDQFGTVSTIRQRSLAAIQNTHINGRLGIGAEALIMARGFAG